MAGGFESLGLMPEILRAVEELDWLLPTDIQDEAIPLILGGGDVMAAAETGSGKTAAFSLPMLQCVWERISDTQEESGKGKESGNDGGMDVASEQPSIRLCSNDKDNLVLLDNVYQATGQAKQQWSGGRATHGIRSGKFYYEVKIETEGIVRLGVSSMAGHLELGELSRHTTLDTTIVTLPALLRVLTLVLSPSCLTMHSPLPRPRYFLHYHPIYNPN